MQIFSFTIPFKFAPRVDAAVLRMAERVRAVPGGVAGRRVPPVAPAGVGDRRVALVLPAGPVRLAGALWATNRTALV